MLSDFLKILDNNSFNRYMVECECLPVEELIEYREGFNRYMVECEFCLKIRWNHGRISF